jgi:hypothetical protein
MGAPTFGRRSSFLSLSSEDHPFGMGNPPPPVLPSPRDITYGISPSVIDSLGGATFKEQQQNLFVLKFDTCHADPVDRNKTKEVQKKLRRAIANIITRSTPLSSSEIFVLSLPVKSLSN